MTQLGNIGMPRGEAVAVRAIEALELSRGLVALS
jgi:hypothetical protein